MSLGVLGCYVCVLKLCKFIRNVFHCPVSGEEKSKNIDDFKLCLHLKLAF